MGRLILEVGMKLDKNITYYHDILIKHGLNLDFACITHDIYYTKANLDGMTENEMKNACIRLRDVLELNKPYQTNQEMIEKEKQLLAEGYKKVFDTIKTDFQYNNSEMKSKVQLQDIKDIGLLVYYDNPDYYEYAEDEQRKLLLEELNSYGFDFKETDLGLDKLRTLYYNKEMFSKNQNA
ncbi:MAG: hypothetical protein IKK43_05685 [Clostridia bacterium]|nr:hypothetical protein [Clostridia bacterium]